MAEQPNDASRKSKAEGDRWDTDGEQTRDQGTNEQSGGITSRSVDEETSDQQVRSRQESKHGSRAGHGASDIDKDTDETRRSER